MDRITFKAGFYAVTVTKGEHKKERQETTIIGGFDDAVEFYTGLSNIEMFTAKIQRLTSGSSGLLISDVTDGQIWKRAYELNKKGKKTKPPEA